LCLKESQTVADILQRRVCKYGDDSGIDIDAKHALTAFIDEETEFSKINTQGTGYHLTAEGSLTLIDFTVVAFCKAWR
jgi:hypothetical protein